MRDARDALVSADRFRADEGRVTRDDFDAWAATALPDPTLMHEGDRRAAVDLVRYWDEEAAKIGERPALDEEPRVEALLRRATGGVPNDEGATCAVLLECEGYDEDTDGPCGRTAAHTLRRDDEELVLCGRCAAIHLDGGEWDEVPS